MVLASSIIIKFIIIGKANQEYTISTVQDELQFLGQVISTAMDANTSEYSQELMSTVETMSDHTAQDILKLIKVSDIKLFSIACYICL